MLYDVSVIDQIHKWQEFLGAFIGAATPIFFWFYIKWNESNEQIKKNRYTIEKILSYHINEVLDTHSTFERFINTQLKELIQQIDALTAENKYCISRAYLPLFSLSSFNDILLTLKTGSSYLDNQMLDVAKVSNDVAQGIIDLRNQFKDSIESNQVIALAMVNSAAAQNSIFRTNMLKFQKVVEEEVYEQSLKPYLRFLVAARVTNLKITDMGIIWKHKFFWRSFKYFKDCKSFMEFRLNVYERIDKFLAEEINTEVNKFLAEF